MFKLVVLSIATFIAATSFAHAKGGARVIDVKGYAFAVKEGQTVKLHVGDVVNDFSEIMTEEGAQISFRDFHDHQYHLSGSGYIKLMNRTIELKRGYLWLQSFSHEKDYRIETANAGILYNDGESIVSFDSASGRSQVLVVSGKVTMENLMEPQLKQDVTSGNFSFVDQEYESGIPRPQTLIGFSSFKKVFALFDGVTPMNQNDVDFFSGKERLANTIKPHKSVPAMKEMKRGKAVLVRSNKSRSEMPKREIASVQDSHNHRRGEVILLKKVSLQARRPASMDMEGFLNERYQELEKKRKKIFVPNYKTKSGIKLKVFGKKLSTNRMPASVVKKVPAKKAKKKVTPVKVKKSSGLKSMNTRLKDTASRNPASIGIPAQKTDETFNKSFARRYERQRRHSTEVNQLIDELKMYRKDFKKDY